MSYLPFSLIPLIIRLLLLHLDANYFLIKEVQMLIRHLNLPQNGVDLRFCVKIRRMMRRVNILVKNGVDLRSQRSDYAVSANIVTKVSGQNLEYLLDWRRSRQPGPL